MHYSLFESDGTMYKTIVFGGTFDHLHKGHKTFIQYAYTVGVFAVIGLTVDSVISKKEYGASLLSYEERKKELTSFLSSIGKDGQYSIVPIHDVFGTTTKDTSIDAIVVTDQTKHGADEINIQRTRVGMSKLPVYVCPMEKDSGFNTISSTRIRAGEINRDGFVYASICTKDIVFTKEQLETLKKPLGALYKNTELTKISSPVSCMLIGDAVTAYFTNHSMSFSIAMCDGKTERKAITLEKKHGFNYVDSHYINPKGTLNHKLFNYMSNHVTDKNTVHFIEGEEDLLAIFAVLLSPLGTKVYYGQPTDKGIVELTVTEQLKEQMKALILQ